MSKGMLADKTD